MTNETVTLELTPSLTCMTVLAVTKDAVYLRLPRELQRDCGGCHCEHCRKDPSLAKWDTLVVPTKLLDYSWTCHMPDAAVQGFRDYIFANKLA